MRCCSGAKLRILGATFFLLSLIAAPATQMTHAQDRLGNTTFVGLEGYAINALAQMPDGRIAVASSRGVWIAAADGSSPIALTGRGLPIDSCLDVESPNGKPCWVSSVAVDADATVYAVFGQSESEHGMSGLFRVTQGAKRWQALGQELMLASAGGFGLRVAGVAIAPDKTVYATVEKQTAVQPMSAGRIFVSTDSGATWTSVWKDEPFIQFDRIAIDPTGRIWVSGGIPGGDHWLLTSTDAGATWAQYGLIPTTAGEASGAHTIRALAFDAVGIVYVTASGGTADYPLGTYRSMDGGLTWTRLTGDDQQLEQFALAVSADDMQLFHSAWGTVRASGDGGSRWADFADFGDTFVSAMVLDASGLLWIGTNSFGVGTALPGLFVSANAFSPGIPVGAPANGGTANGGQDTVKNSARSDCLVAGGRFYEDPDGSYGCIPAGTTAECPEQPDETGTTPCEEEVIFEHHSLAAVFNGPPPETFVIEWDVPHLITRVRTYHWNDAQGKTPGTISLVSEDGTVYGPWQTVGLDGQGGVPNAYWEATPMEVLPAGAYIVVDSDPETWSRNADTNGEGVTWIYGCDQTG